ncbi:resolvase [Acinetobacter seifertii]|uniref:recombinase family protein n=1 Tax=Acinetobacter seifertii TaxID=1530123 RepID=UPI00280C600B|nr:recombinase family protein [Acinetobacter seifertii]MDQ9038202.1 resolvase [Acinetobacter seifertii]
MRVFAYSRLDVDVNVDIDIDIEKNNYIKMLYEMNYKIPNNRIVFEEVTINTSVFFRERIINLVNYALEENDLLIVKSIDCLGCGFEEIYNFSSKIIEKNIKIICLDYSRHQIDGNIKTIFKHFLKICMEHERKILKTKKSYSSNFEKKVGRPEILTIVQKKAVLDKFKKGQSIYSLAKEFSVTRTVIQRVIDKTINKNLC